MARKGTLVYISEKVVDYVLDDLGRHGIGLSYSPALRYYNGVRRRKDGTKTLAAVRGEGRIIDRVGETVKDELYKSLFGHFGIDVSSEAVRELELAMIRRGKTFQKKLDEQPDDEWNNPIEIEEGEIVLTRDFAHLRRHSHPARLLHVLGHEVWHLVEMDYGVSDSYPLIEEGTAEFAGQRISGAKVKSEVGFVNLDCFEYYGIASIIKERFKGRDNPYKALLDRRRRKGINTAAIREIHKVPVSVKKPDMEGAVRIGDKDMIRLLDNPTKEELLRFWRSIGAKKLAEEAEGQDLSIYLLQYTPHPFKPQG
jgi:hypothetical protein